MKTQTYCMKKRNFLFLLLFSFLQLNQPFIALSEENKAIKNSPSLDYLKKINKEEYIVGKGDYLKIIVDGDVTDFDTNVEKGLNSSNRKIFGPSSGIYGFSGIYEIDTSGQIYMPQINRIYIAGLTVSELINILNERLREVLINPSVNIVILRYRPVRVYVSGQVETPGLYTLAGEYNANNISRDSNKTQDITDSLNFDESRDYKIPNIVSQRASVEITDSTNQLSSIFHPTVFDALQRAGGINSYSDLSNIEVVRENTLSAGGGKIMSKLNFLDFIQNGQSSQNIRLFDGDLIRVPKSKKILSAQLSEAIRSNLNPRFIKIFLSGRVESPGPITVSKASTLSDAIEAAGGARFFKGNVIFTRFNNDGSIDRRTFGYNRSKKRGSYKNPYLKNGDIIRIGKGVVATANEILTEIAGPFVPIYSTYGIVKSLTNE